MTQHWGPPPNYPPPRPPQPRYLLPAPAPQINYPPPADSPAQRISYFVAGSCVSFIFFMLCCICTPAFLWVVDEALGITNRVFEADNVTPNGSPAPAQAQSPEVFQPTPLPENSSAAQAQAEQPQAVSSPTPTLPSLPFAIGQPVLTSDTGVELTVWDIQRTVQPVNLAPADGLEFVAISVQLRNARPDGAKRYEITDFVLQDAQGNIFLPDPQADNGRRLQGGEIPVDGLTEGDLLFYIPLGYAPLTLVWQGTGSEEVYAILLQ